MPEHRENVEAVSPSQDKFRFVTTQRGRRPAKPIDAKTSNDKYLEKIEKLCHQIIQHDNEEPDFDELAVHDNAQQIDKNSDEERIEKIKKMVERIREMEEKDMENK